MFVFWYKFLLKRQMYVCMHKDKPICFFIQMEIRKEQKERERGECMRFWIIISTFSLIDKTTTIKRNISIDANIKNSICICMDSAFSYCHRELEVIGGMVWIVVTEVSVQKPFFTLWSFWDKIFYRKCMHLYMEVFLYSFWNITCW